MHTAETGSAPEFTCSVEYQTFTGSEHNPTFKGRGTLAISLDGPTYTFTGQQRRFLAGSTTELVLNANDISNVTIADRAIRFKVNSPEGSDRPFIFYCRDLQEAINVARFFPTRTDREFDETRNFTERLSTLVEHFSPWTSVTNIIVALNVIVFVVMAGLLGAGWITVDSMQPYMLYGANNGAATTGGEWWRLVTSMYMHYGVIHLLFNMWALFQTGHFLERLQGRVLYALIYLGSGLAGGFASIFWHGDKIWSAGASGAIFGVYGAIFGYLLREKEALPKGVYQSLMKSSLMFAGYNILFGMSAGIDSSAHVGGALGGIVFGWLLAMPVEREARARLVKKRVPTALIALVILIVAGISLTPRFDYRFREDFALKQINGEFVKKEPPLIERLNDILKKLDSGGDNAAQANWMTAEIVPFYEKWSAEITALKLTHDLQTALRRDELNNILHLRLQSYQDLIAGLRTHDPQAFTRFEQANQLVRQANIKAAQVRAENSQRKP